MIPGRAKVALETGSESKIGFMPDTLALQSELDPTVAYLSTNLGPNLHSLILYGSAARGEFIEERSDINLLIVLEASTPQAHSVLRELRLQEQRLQPFVVERGGMQRATQVFGLKFLSIQRHYRVLHGADPLKDLQLSDALHVLLAEQECRNLRMRLTHAYITADRDLKSYGRFVVANAPRFFIVLSDVARCASVELPDSLEARVEILSRTFQANAESLRNLWRLHQGSAKLSSREAQQMHQGLLPLLSAALTWIETRWPKLPI